MDGTPVREVTMRTDHELHGEVFECSCGECWSWSAGVDVGEQCVHILVVALMLMPDM